MKNIAILTIGFLFVSSGIAAQDTLSLPTKAIKVYSNYFSDEFRVGATDSTTNLTISYDDFTNIGSLSFGYAWSIKPRVWHEISCGFALNRNRNIYQVIPVQGGTVQTIRGTSNTTATFSARYERYRQLSNKEKINFKLGSSYELFWLSNRQTPILSNTFPTRYNKLALNIALVPRITIPFKRFAIDINTPINVIQTSFSSQYIDNPALQEYQKTNSSFDYELLRRENLVQARVGISWFL